MRLHSTFLILLIAPLIAAAAPAPAEKRMVLIDQDGSGPGGSNQMAMMVLLQSPEVDVLGITMVTGHRPGGSGGLARRVG